MGFPRNAWIGITIKTNIKPQRKLVFIICTSRATIRINKIGLAIIYPRNIGNIWRRWASFDNRFNIRPPDSFSSWYPYNLNIFL